MLSDFSCVTQLRQGREGMLIFGFLNTEAEAVVLNPG